MKFTIHQSITILSRLKAPRNPHLCSMQATHNESDPDPRRAALSNFPLWLRILITANRATQLPRARNMPTPSGASKNSSQLSIDVCACLLSEVPYFRLHEVSPFSPSVLSRLHPGQSCTSLPEVFRSKYDVRYNLVESIDRISRSAIYLPASNTEITPSTKWTS